MAAIFPEQVSAAYKDHTGQNKQEAAIPLNIDAQFGEVEKKSTTDGSKSKQSSEP